MSDEYIKKEDIINLAVMMQTHLWTREQTYNAIFCLPSADVAPVRHGHWIDEGEYADYTNVHAWRCSECEDHVLNYKCDLSRYCPNCGAKMDEVKDDDKID